MYGMELRTHLNEWVREFHSAECQKMKYISRSSTLNSKAHTLTPDTQKRTRREKNTGERNFQKRIGNETGHSGTRTWTQYHFRYFIPARTNNIMWIFLPEENSVVTFDGTWRCTEWNWIPAIVIFLWFISQKVGEVKKQVNVRNIYTDSRHF